MSEVLGRYNVCGRAFGTFVSRNRCHTAQIFDRRKNLGNNCFFLVFEKAHFRLLENLQ